MLFSVVFAFLVSFTFAKDSQFHYGSRENLAVYWGQNTLSTVTGTSEIMEKNLTDYCNDDTVNIILLSFMNVFPGNNDVPTLTLHGHEYSSQYEGELSTVAEQIQTCQDNGKIVMLSLGGEGGNYGFNDDGDAEQFADTLWEMFGDANSTEQVRPFGDVKLDGFDLDIESNSSTGYQALGDSLRQKFEGASKRYYLSAAPQCPYPESALGPTLNNTWLDFAFIQFYNNQYNCDANTDNFNWITWANWASDVSKNKDVKLFMGLPGSSSSANSGYISDTDLLKQKIELASSNATFGGVMLWDASTADNNTEVKGRSYLDVVKSALTKDLSKKYYANGTYEDAKNFGTSVKSNLLMVVLSALVAVWMF